MAQQGTDEKQEPAGQEGAGQEPAAEDGTGRHAAAEESTEKDASAEQPAEQSSSSSEQQTEEKASAEKPAERQASEQQTEKQARSEPPTEKNEVQRSGQGDTSWAEGEHAGTTRHRSVDVGELAWRTGNVLATVVRALALLFALVLVVNVVLVLVGVNPSNGVAQFVGTVADIVILGFRNLFVPANPLAMLIVNSLIAAVFWVFVGELLSRLIRFVAARVK